MQPLKHLRNPKCNACDVHRSARTVCIMGKGLSPARLMILGESPGEDEDKQGEVFVGKTGKLLDSILINLKIKDYYVTNVCKCHPLYNSKPPLSKLNVCAGLYLRKEIELVKPELIICLGGLAAKVLTQENSLSVGNSRRNLYYTKGPMPENVPYIVTYHPAATFHKPELLEFIVKDFEFALDLLNNKIPYRKKETNYRQLDSVYSIPGIRKTKWVDLDLETDGLDPFLPNKDILSTQISIKEGEGYYFDWNDEIAQELKDLLISSSSPALNGHNIKFDLKFLRSHAGIDFQGKINDTIQNIHLLDENFPSKSLDSVASCFTELKGHKDQLVKLINVYIKMHKRKKEPISRARQRLWSQAFKAISARVRIRYGCGDADATGRLRRIFRKRLKEDGLIPLHNLMMDATKMYVDIECNGVKIDEELADRFKVDYENRMDDMVKQMGKIVPYEINPRAPLQLKQLLYGTWKLPMHEIRMGRRRVRYSTGKDALELILLDDIKQEHRDFIQTLLEYRKTSKLHGTYLEGLPRYLRDGYIHAVWNLVGTDTGRTSCNGPNLQQIPRTGDIKSLFISRYRKGALLQVDVSQGELRIAAHESDEPTLIKLFKSGTADIHRSVTAELLGKPEKEVTDEQRFNGKTINFAVLFGSGDKTTAQAMKGITVEEAHEFIKRWHRRFSRWNEFVKEREEFVIANHYVRNIFGRYRRLFVLDPDSYEGATTLRKAINAPIQGGLSDYNKLCGTRVWKKLKTYDEFKQVLFILEAHDAWVLDMPKQLIKPVVQIIKEEFENVDTSEFGFSFKVPMKVEIKTGPNWKDMETV